MKKFIVITTINSKSEAIKAFEKKKDWHIIVVGDKKSVEIPDSDNLTFLSVEKQHRLDYRLVDVCPYNHYTRKNVGYLYALQNGADIIFDTDDDNIPYPHWQVPDFIGEYALESAHRTINVYRYFSDEFIWPRGFPLDDIHTEKTCRLKTTETAKTEIGMWQGITDEDPDVDAIFRLIMNRKIRFLQKQRVYLPKGYYCPTNSQNTAWNKKAFAYMYLPAFVSFRFTDILRGYIAQRLMWEQGLYTGFSEPRLHQERNQHDLMKDFHQETECYLNVKPILGLLDRLELFSDPVESLMTVYKELFKGKYISEKELAVLDAWVEDFRRLSV